MLRGPECPVEYVAVAVAADALFAAADGAAAVKAAVAAAEDAAVAAAEDAAEDAVAANTDNRRQSQAVLA